jgi:serine/threonine-protein kinase
VTLDALRASLADRYTIERELGQGGMATVYLARDLKHDREVAVKVLRPDLGAVLGADRFLEEIKITARLDHPHILTLIDSGATDGMLYYVLPYVRGETLRGRLEREKQLGIEEAIGITTQIASALDYAHRQGVVHRDIKPENIMFQEGEAMLADFGIALAVKEAGGDRLTQTGLSLGTPQYMSPEQATGDRALDARSDVYSLAAVLYEMLTGDPPVTGATAQAMIAKLMTERPTRIRVVRDAVPEPVDTAIFKALAKIPADRFSGAREFVDALDAGMRPEMPTAARPSARGRTLGVLAAVAVVILAATAVATRGRGGGTTGGPAVTLNPGRQVSFVGDVRTFAVAPDDRTVAYLTPDLLRVVLFDLDGGGSQTLYTAPQGSVISDLQWSPDGARLLLTAWPYQDRVFSVPRLGGATREELRLPEVNSLSGSKVWQLEGGRWLVVGASNTFYLGTDPESVQVDGTQLAGPGSFKIPGLDAVDRPVTAHGSPIRGPRSRDRVSAASSRWTTRGRRAWRPNGPGWRRWDGARTPGTWCCPAPSATRSPTS